MVVSLLLTVASAVVLFLYGIEHLSVELQKRTGEGFRKVMKRFAANRWSGAFLGAITTAGIQSSSATTVITLSLVNAGMLTFRQSLGVIAGANIGTTLTSLLVAFKFSGFAQVFLVLGFILSLIGGKWRMYSKPIFYFGFVFFTISLITDSIEPIRNSPEVIGFLASLDNPVFGVLAGTVLTALFQSSSVMTGLAVMLGMSGMINVYQAIPLILGANIGTTTTSLLASSKMDVYAKRTAIAHFTFNVFGALLFLPLMGLLAETVIAIGGNTENMIANAHVIFNFTTTIVFLLLIRPIEKAIVRLFPSKRPQIVFETKYISEMPVNLHDASLVVLKEFRHELEQIQELFYLSYGMVKHAAVSEMQRVEILESLTDYLDDKVFEALIELSQRQDLSKEYAAALSKLSQISHEIEQLADLGKDIADLGAKLKENGVKLSPPSKKELRLIRRGLEDNLKLLVKLMPAITKRELSSIHRSRVKLDRLIGKAYTGNIKRLTHAKKASKAGAVNMEVVSIYEQANSTILRIARHMQVVYKVLKKAK